MTTLSKPIRRETGIYIRGRAMMLEVGAHEITVRRKGMRAERYSIPLAALWPLGAKIAAREAAAEKAAAKKKR